MSETCVRHIKNSWESKTKASNIFFNEGNLNDALEGYKEAIYKSEILNNNKMDCIKYNIPFVQIYMISCNNIAYTYEKLGILDKTDKMLRRAIYFLFSLSLEIPSISKKFIKDLKLAVLGYQTFIKKHNLKIEDSELLMADIIAYIKESNRKIIYN